MPTRRYRLDKRAEAVAATRRRIVEATFALHGEQGIAATTMKQIAARAGVGIGTVYNHFPTYDAVVRACGAHTNEALPPPGPEILAGATGATERVRRLVRALYAYYDAFGDLDMVRCEADRIAALGEAMAEWDRRRATLVAEALKPLRGRGRRFVPVVAALLDSAVHTRLRRGGITTAAAAELIGDAILAWVAPPGTERNRGG